MEVTRILKTSLFIFTVVYHGYQKCAAYPENPSQTPSMMEVDEGDTAKKANQDESATPKSDAVDQSPDKLKSFSEQIAGRGPDKIAYPENASQTSSMMEVDEGDTAKKANQDKSATLKSDAVDQSSPDKLKRFSEQIAGRGQRPDRIGIMNDESGNVYKPNPVKAEVEFFEKLKNTTDPVLGELRDFAPRYFGTKIIPVDGADIEFIHMENIMKGYKKPCSIDVKIKHIIWDPPFKPEYLLRFKPMTDAFGFGITGFKYYNVMTGIDFRNPREYVFTLTPNEGIQTLYKFLNGEIGIKCGVLKKIMTELHKIRAWFEKQHEVIINNNSVLLTYDAEDLVAYVKQVKQSTKEGKPNTSCEHFDVPVRVRMVFFGKVVEIKQKDKRDEEYLQGLETLIPMLEDITRRNAETYYDPLLSSIEP